MKQQRILLIIGGGIAAYKCLDLVRRLRDEGASVRAVMTRAALQRAHAETQSGGGPDREHVTPYLRRADWARKLYYVHRDGPDGRGGQTEAALPGGAARAVSGPPGG